MRYKSCRLAEHGIYFYLDPGSLSLCVGHCCNSDHLNLENRLYLYSDLKAGQLDWDYVFAEKEKFRNNAKLGIYPSQCDGCFELCDRDWDCENYISHLTLAHITKCNSRCTYCFIGRDKHRHLREQDIDIQPVINQLLEKNLLRFNGSLRFVGGEPTLMKEFESTVKLFSDNAVPEIYVPTSAIKFSENLRQALESVPSAAIVVSVDSGCSETYAKIKGTNFYDIVIENLKKYISSAKEKNFIISKFILLTGLNDNTVEIDKWLDECNNIGMTDVQFDAEHTVASSPELESRHFAKHTVNMLAYTEAKASLYNIKVTSFLAFMNRTKAMLENDKKIQHSASAESKTLYLPSDTPLVQGKYSDIYINLDDITFPDLQKTLQDAADKDYLFLSDKKAFLSSDTEIVDREDFAQITTLLLRYGFDLYFETSTLNFSPIISEILKTSNSEITFVSNVKKIAGIFTVCNIDKVKKLISLYKNEQIFGSIKINFRFAREFSETEKEKFIKKYC